MSKRNRWPAPRTTRNCGPWDQIGQIARIGHRHKGVLLAMDDQRGHRNTLCAGGRVVSCCRPALVHHSSHADTQPSGKALYARRSSLISVGKLGAVALDPPAVVAASTRVLTLSGCRMASSCATMPPRDKPKTCADSNPWWRNTSRASRAIDGVVIGAHDRRRGPGAPVVEHDAGEVLSELMNDRTQ